MTELNDLWKIMFKEGIGVICTIHPMLGNKFILFLNETFFTKQKKKLIKLTPTVYGRESLSGSEFFY
jgi:hypothetical protein